MEPMDLFTGMCALTNRFICSKVISFSLECALLYSSITLFTVSWDSSVKSEGMSYIQEYIIGDCIIHVYLLSFS